MSPWCQTNLSLIVFQAALNILPVAELRHPVSLSTSVHFWGPQSIKEIISTVYHLVHDRHRLLHHHHAAPLADNVNHLTFLLDHDHDYPILENQLRDLELSFGGAISLFSVGHALPSILYC